MTEKREKAALAPTVLAGDLVAKLGKHLVGCTVTTEAVGDWAGGDSEVTYLGDDAAAPEIVYAVKRVADGETVGVFEHESVQLVLNRHGIVAKARALRDEIHQIFVDTESWNDNARQPDEDPIDPDPDGELSRILQGLNRGIAREDALLERGG